GNLRRVERRFLQLRHPHRHRRHHAHVRITAYRFSTVAVIGLELRLVADADLPQLDARLEVAGEVLNQFAEVDALPGEGVKYDPLAAEEVFDIDQSHLQFTVADE